MKPLATFVPSASVQVAASEPAKVRRSRHHPRSFAVAYGAFMLFFAFACFIGFAWFTAKLALTADRSYGILALSLLVCFGGARLLAFLNNRHLSCTLCHGTILHEKRCRKHVNATRIPGLSYRAAAVTSVLCTGNFRCMYCGTPYRLKK